MLVCQNNYVSSAILQRNTLSSCQPTSTMLPWDSMKIRLIYLLLFTCLTLFSACTTTPSERIAKNMVAYEQLPKGHQTKVIHGELEKDMTPIAVLLAWGKPEQKIAGRINGKNTERWIYTKGGSGWSIGLGGGGFHGRSSGIGTGLGVTMPLGHKATTCNVLFEQGKVIAWETTNGI